jgi:ribosomal protein S12 methylthiotransferase accessory factor
MIESASIQLAKHAIERLNISVETVALQGWPLQSVSALAKATKGANAETPAGYGGSHDLKEAATLAAIEFVERYAQFRTDVPTPDVISRWDDLREHAISPLEFGLYEGAQYAAANFPCQPFDPRQPIEWTRVSDLLDGTAHLAPCEFIYPNAPLGRVPLVCETSSGCAAHFDETSARLAALCEVIERDAAMLFWYRQPPTSSFLIEDVGMPAMTEDIEHVRRLGYVVVIANLENDLGIPSFLAIAMQEYRFAYGLGCHPHARNALSHAVGELLRGLAWLHVDSVSGSVRRSFGAVCRPRHHYELYNSAPRHDILRQVLKRTLRPSVPAGLLANLATPPLAPTEALAKTLEALAARRFRAYGCDITPPVLCDAGVHVVRALVPGLVPLHFGFDRLRLGCERLSSVSGPGRFGQMLPHFIH